MQKCGNKWILPRKFFSSSSSSIYYVYTSENNSMVNESEMIHAMLA